MILFRIKFRFIFHMIMAQTTRKKLLTLLTFQFTSSSIMLTPVLRILLINFLLFLIFLRASFQIFFFYFHFIIVLLFLLLDFFLLFFLNIWLLVLLFLNMNIYLVLILIINLILLRYSLIVFLTLLLILLRLWRLYLVSLYEVLYLLLSH